MLVTLNKLWHVPYELRITTLETIFTKTLFGVSRSWSHAFLVTDIRMLNKRLLEVRPKTLRRKRRKKKKEAIPKLFALHANGKIKVKNFIVVVTLLNFAYTFRFLLFPPFHYLSCISCHVKNFHYFLGGPHVSVDSFFHF